MFPRAWLRKKGYDDRRINHIANITLVDDFLNKRVIKAQTPGVSIRQFQRENEQLKRTLATHLIGNPETFGILENDYDIFFRRRCRRLSAELRKRILPAEADEVMSASPASETADSLALEEEAESEA